jgi:hypothetical protein
MLAPPHRGACRGTRVLDSPRLATADELDRVASATRTPNGNPDTDSSDVADEVRQR